MYKYGYQKAPFRVPIVLPMYKAPVGYQKAPLGYLLCICINTGTRQAPLGYQQAPFRVPIVYMYKYGYQKAPFRVPDRLPLGYQQAPLGYQTGSPRVPTGSL